MYVGKRSCTSIGAGVNIRSGFGSVSVVDTELFSRALGRGTGSSLRKGCIRVVSFGDNVLESPCAHGTGVIGRVSVADASLSLSLSLGSPVSNR